MEENNELTNKQSETNTDKEEYVDACENSDDEYNSCNSEDEDTKKNPEFLGDDIDEDTRKNPESLRDDIDEEFLASLEKNMSEEEKQESKVRSIEMKEEGNKLFGMEDYRGAIDTYTSALKVCPVSFTKDRAMMYGNRAAAKLYLELDKPAIEDCSKAIELYPEYIKALLRRAALYEKTEMLDEALKDYDSILKLNPNHHTARTACARLPAQIQERNEKLKAEMLGNIKKLGNIVLNPFGLSTDNFKVEQDPNTGSYSVQFQNNSSSS